ncbi:hypothetical protein ACVNHC_03305 [Pannonibacter sp. Q-1]
MASNNHNDEKTVVLLIFGAIWALVLVAFALFAFIAFVLTILAICAWNKPLHPGKLSIEPEEARAFVGRGLVGMWIVPAFALFVNVFLGVHINWGYLSHMMVIGYVGGSVGVQFLLVDDNEGAPASAPLREEVLPPPYSQQALPPAPREPFNYASWDDEEENRR